MDDHPVDRLLRLAFLEGHVNTRGAWETAVSGRTVSEKVSPDHAARLEEKLVAALAASVSGDLLTVGTYLRSVHRGAGIGLQKLPSRLGVTGNVYRMLEHDRISPLRIPPEVWRRFQTLWNIPFDVLEGMLRRSHQLVYFRPSYRATLARYRHGERAARRTVAMQQAVMELYARARLELPPEEERKMKALLDEVSR
jgi:hypothetical protein